MKIIDTGIGSASENMECDASLLEGLSQDQTPILHLYDWSGPSLTYGYFSDPFQFLDEVALLEHQFQKARRPTGGGIIFHVTDFAFSILLPNNYPGFSSNTLQNYALVNRFVIECIRRFLGRDVKADLLLEVPETKGECCNFCMAHPTVYDVMIEGKKVGGAAQRRTKAGLLHQGSISLLAPDVVLLKQLFKPGSGIPEKMSLQTHALLDDEISLVEARGRFKGIMSDAFEKLL